MVRNYLKLIGFFIFLSGNCFAANEGMPQLNPDYWISQIFWVMLIFGTLYVILWKAILPKINENLENRKSQILTDLDEAQELKNQSEKKISEYNMILSKAKQDAKKILDGTRKKISLDIENKNNQFNLEINKEIENAEKEIKTLKLSSIKDINKISIETSSEIVRKMVGTEINSSSVSAAVEDISKKEIIKYI
ncbi:MAG: F0F1 ATP synthase subunit B [Candidatus Pelagibacter sp.]|jgi:F-type H+-transporting ATPase subunit b|nr:F0F1 ATP synthase subunit B [Candidatus Pelagibacter sp.]MDP6440109.1 F0F1 ATP synthase subunit B [Pelagibacteraceae bacterium]|tara:strand:+ start:18828 stop:19406 length:579 start_codon:yes stop_codon:yes gene_type:complete